MVGEGGMGLGGRGGDGDTGGRGCGVGAVFGYILPTFAKLDKSREDNT